ncbi:IS110 family transposase [Frankia sp. CNm7]|uniref:IS110 family transposase n=1 Tax=Frankia nepalensis TaxID=1836974 RepID=A0A937R5R4_9ACTN|nr:IS110 family transposase [Frankia nepalensis]MBL7498727.1 IS110 family transposase [Frankia nepalensis]MBL7508408.1 IS110 family transposase [Frankia nepalensis]MBL7517408.1 IS110 family transposase [Frankia nepalensis]MBL7626238.1 IS110 family transposase [Frankia nepalensis]
MGGSVEVVVDDAEQILERVAAIDVAKASGKVCVRVPHDTKEGRRVTRVFDVVATVPAVEGLADHLVCQGIERVVLESTSDYWRVFYYLLEERGLEVWLVNARDVKNVPGRPKTDKLDAVWLAKLNERSMLRRSFVPPVDIRRMRDVTRMRVDLVADRTRAKQRGEKVLEGALIKLSSVVSDLFGVAGRRILDALVAGERDPRRLAALGTGLKASPEALTAALTGRFSDHDAFLLKIYLDQVDALDQQIATLSARVEQMTAAMLLPARQSGTVEPAGATVVDGVPGTVSTVTGEIIPPAADAPADATPPPTDRPPVPRTVADLVDLLDQVPGIGRDSAQLILAEIGMDMSPFPTSGHLASWAKLTSRTIQTGASLRMGRTGRGNRYVRRTLGTAAVSAGRTNTFLGVRHRRLRARRGGLKALVATSRAILEIIWRMVHDQVPFRELGADHHTRQPDPERRKHALVRQMKNLGVSPEEAASMLAAA